MKIGSVQVEKGKPMPRYIDSKEAYDVLTQNYNHKTEIQHIMLESVLNKVHTADVRENKRGTWEYSESMMLGNPYGSYRCSACGDCSPHRSNFCPHCGADMREGE